MRGRPLHVITDRYILRAEWRLLAGFYVRAKHQWPRDRVDRVGLFLFAKGTSKSVPWPEGLRRRRCWITRASHTHTHRKRAMWSHPATGGSGHGSVKMMRLSITQLQ